MGNDELIHEVAMSKSTKFTTKFSFFNLCFPTPRPHPDTPGNIVLKTASWTSLYSSDVNNYNCMAMEQSSFLNGYIKKQFLPWLVWLSGLSAGLWTKGLPDSFPVRARAWVVGQVLRCLEGALKRQLHMFLSVS